jgi:hypothetical protein
MDLSRLKRMRRPRAAARRMAQASVERRREERVPGVDMVESPEGNARYTRKNVWIAAAMKFLEKGWGADGTSYNNSVSA